MWKHKTITKLQQAPHSELLRSLYPFRHCDDRALGLLAQQSELLQAPSDCVIFERRKEAGDLYFVVDGTVKLVDATGESRLIAGGSILSHLPLNPAAHCSDQAIVTDTATMIRLDRKEAERIAGRILTSTAGEESPAPQEKLGEEIYLAVYQALQAGSLELPSMPSTGVRIARHLEDPSADSDSIARIVQMDPALTARLIQVANSPAFKGRSRIESCRHAITRLGQSTTRDLVISFVLKGIFRSREPDLQKRMEAVWRHSTKVAAISFALARRIPDLDAGQAMLAGLMHDIGVIPVLIGAERHPALAQNRVMLDQLVKMLRADCGAMMLQKWGFGEEFIDVARHADDWQYDSGGEPGYSDVVIIAQMHSHIGTPQMAEIPRIDTVPAFRKMMLGEVGPSLSLQVIEEAREEIGAMQQLLQ